MPSHQPGFDLAKFRLEPDILVPSVENKSLQRREVLVAGNAYQQRLDFVGPPWLHQPNSAA